MRALLIDPIERTIREVDYNGNYKQIYELLGIGNSPFDARPVNDAGDAVFFDDEGLLKEPTPTDYFFVLYRNPQPIAGKGLILGTDAEGESIATTLSLEEARKVIKFARLTFRGFEPIPEGTMTDSPILGRVPVVGLHANFEQTPEDRSYNLARGTDLEIGKRDR